MSLTTFCILYHAVKFNSLVNVQNFFCLFVLLDSFRSNLGYQLVPECNADVLSATFEVRVWCRVA